MTTIFYTTNTGTTKRYAALLSEKTGFPCLPAEEADAGATDDAVYLGWIFSGEIQGLARFRETGIPLRAVGAVGIMEQESENVRAACGDTPFFFLPGAFDVKKLKGLYKLMAGMIVKTVKAKLKDNPTPNAQKLLAVFEDGLDLFSEDAANALAEAVTTESTSSEETAG